MNRDVRNIAGLCLLELLVGLLLGSIVLATAGRYFSATSKNISLLNTRTKSEQSTNRIMEFLEDSCAQSRTRFGLSLVAHAKNRVVDSRGRTISVRQGIKANSSSLAFSLLNPRSILQKSQDSNYYCAQQPVAYDNPFYLAITAGETKLLNVGRAKSRCLLRDNCKCQISFAKLHKKNSVHTLIQSSENFTIYLSKNNVLRYKSLENSLDQPLAYDIELFRIEERDRDSHIELEISLKHRLGRARMITCALSPKRFHYLDAIF